MTKESLIKKSAEVLGVSSSEREFGYELLIERILENLKLNEAISIPGLGIFSLQRMKISEEAKANTGEANVKSNLKLIYSPDSEIKPSDSKSVFLKLDIPMTNKNTFDFDESVFSISVGKPMVPITPGEELDDDPETSHLILQKTIEDRIAELISNSEKKNDFDIWDDLMDEQKSESDDHVQDKEVSADEDDEKSKRPESLATTLNAVPNEEFEDSDTITDLDDLDQFMSDETDQEISDDEILSPEDEVTEEINDSEDIPELLDEQNEELPEEIIEPETEEEINLEEALETAVTGVDESEEAIEEVQNEVEEPILNEEENIPEVDEQNTDPIDESNSSNSSNQFDEMRQQIADELKEELQVSDEATDENIEEDLEDNIDEQAESVNDLDQLDSFIDGDNNEETSDENSDEEAIDTELKEDEVNNEIANQEEIPEEINEEQNLENDSEEIGLNLEEEHLPNSENNTDIKMRKNSFGKTPWIIFGAFIVVSIAAFYFLFMVEGAEDGNNPPQKMFQDNNTSIVDPNKQNEESDKPAGNTDQNNPAVTDDSVKQTPPPVEVAKEEEITWQFSGDINQNLKSEVPNERKVDNIVFFDGTKYNVQISSWQSSTVAESEVVKFRKKGFNAFLTENYIEKLKGTWYRVKIGFFKTEQEAKDFLQKNNIR